MCRSAQPKSDVHDLGLALHAKWESTFLEHFQHRAIVGQDFSNQFLESSFSGNRGEVMHEGRAETLPLILIDHGESDLGLSRLHDDVTGAARDHGPAAFVNDCDQCDVIDEIDIHEKGDFGFGEAAFYREETAVKRLSAATTDCFDKIGPVVRSKRADFDAASIVQRLECRSPNRMASNAITSCDGRCRRCDLQPTEAAFKRPLENSRMSKLPISLSQTKFQLPA